MPRNKNKDNKKKNGGPFVRNTAGREHLKELQQMLKGSTPWPFC